MMKVRIVGLGLLVVGCVALLLGVVAPSAAAAGDQALIRGVPALKQTYNLSCEYAAASAVTRFWGNPITEEAFMRAIPTNPNPHVGFRGNIFGLGGGINDYGIYADPLIPVLRARGFDATMFYGDVERLKANLRVGNPAVVWLTTGRDVARPVYTRSYAGQTFTLVPYEHAVVAYGYNATGVRLMDVGDGNYYLTPWDSFLRRWGYFDQMTLVIRPQ